MPSSWSVRRLMSLSATYADVREGVTRWLESAHRTDAFVKELWDTMQAMPQYHGTTTFIITADHGRGSGPVEWKDHGVHEKGSENVWIAVIGPDTPALGERTNIAPVTQAQIAA